MLWSDSDLQEFERDITFDADVQEVSFDLEVYDDQLSETDRCAVAVSIKDNDSKKMWNIS